MKIKNKHLTNEVIKQKLLIYKKEGLKAKLKNKETKTFLSNKLILR